MDGYKLKVEIAGKPRKPKGPQPNDECRYCHKLGHWKNSCPEYRRKSSRQRFLYLGEEDIDQALHRAHLQVKGIEGNI